MTTEIDKAMTIGPFRVLLIQTEGGMFVAQGIDYDLCVQAKTVELLVQNFWHVVASEILLALQNPPTEPLSGGFVPSKYLTRWLKAKLAE